jgi:hypothetical protein
MALIVLSREIVCESFALFAMAGELLDERWSSQVVENRVFLSEQGLKGGPTKYAR